MPETQELRNYSRGKVKTPEAEDMPFEGRHIPSDGMAWRSIANYFFIDSNKALTAMRQPTILYGFFMV
ncbi:hypothetical protein [Polaromonas sp. CG_9.11]|uniref:hypothetical protein n=1 Tax=Polaromonas sp. CG_9.11 TaxID=2787730 RepID=UPI0018CA2E2B|nr:hypothetical protein [Polaromonas sp. CG_9.11]MBG6074543.1 hypothetical protein [Polaromonas sp. CG_9.11]